MEIHVPTSPLVSRAGDSSNMHSSTPSADPVNDFFQKGPFGSDQDVSISTPDTPPKKIFARQMSVVRAVSVALTAGVVGMVGVVTHGASTSQGAIHGEAAAVAKELPKSGLPQSKHPQDVSQVIMSAPQEQCFETEISQVPVPEAVSSPSFIDHLQGALTAFSSFARILPEMRKAMIHLREDIDAVELDRSAEEPELDLKTARKTAKELLSQDALGDVLVGSTAVLKTETGHRSATVIDPHTALTTRNEQDSFSLKAVGSGARHHLEANWKLGVSDYTYSAYGDRGLGIVTFTKDLFPDQPIALSEKPLEKGDPLVICGSPSGNLGGSSRMRLSAVVLRVDDDGTIFVEVQGASGAGMAGGPVLNARKELVGIYAPAKGGDRVIPVSSTDIEQMRQPKSGAPGLIGPRDATARLEQ